MNYYDEFGIPQTASAQEIRASYKKLVRLVHPDRCGDPELRMLAEIQTKRLNRILSILLTRRKKQRYDSTLTGERPKSKGRSSPQGWYWCAIGALAVISFLLRDGHSPHPARSLSSHKRIPPLLA